MADYKDSPRLFPKGVSGNKKGRPKVLPELQGINPMRPQDLKRLVSKYFRMPYEQLLEDQKDWTLSGLDLVIIATITKAVRTGDFTKIAPLLERVIGKVKEESDMSISYDAQLAEVPPQELISYLRSKRQTPEIIDSES